jgi:hypothetical protein
MTFQIFGKYFFSILIWSSALEEGKANREKYCGLRPNHSELAEGVNPGNLGGKCGKVA